VLALRLITVSQRRANGAKRGDRVSSADSRRAFLVAAKAENG